MQNRKIIIIGLIIVTTLILGFMYWEKPIDISYPAIRFVIGEKEFEEVTVRINGVLHWSYFRDDRLRYEMFIDGNKIPFNEEGKYVVPGQFKGKSFTLDDVQSYENPMIDEKIWKRNHSGAEYLSIDISYFYINENGLELFKFGNMYSSKGFEDLIITPFRINGKGSNWSSTEGYEIIVTKSNIEEAEQFAMELMNMDISVD